MTSSHSDKAALRGEPSYVWRDGQQRRLQMILDAAGGASTAVCSRTAVAGSYLMRLNTPTNFTVGLDVELSALSMPIKEPTVFAGGRISSLPGRSFDLILSKKCSNTCRMTACA